MTHSFSIFRQFAGSVIYYIAGPLVLKAGNEKDEYVSQGLRAKKNVM
jgi:hypothetical protein